MIAALLSLIPGPWLIVLKEIPWRLVGLAVLAVSAGVLYWRVTVWHEAYETGRAAMDAERRCLDGSYCLKRASAAGDAASKAVGKAVQAARERAAREERERTAAGQAEAARLAGAATRAQAQAEAWSRRFARAQAERSTCKTWSEEVVPCPLD